jgi:peptidyl-prolyl isomerase G (cyclophilin G)/arginine/serine-rich splicing factor 7/serine/arginine repetitive matrix protein 1
MNVDFIKKNFSEYNKTSQKKFDSLTEQYKERYTFSDKQEKNMKASFDSTMKDIQLRPHIFITLDELESYLKNPKSSTEKDTLKYISYDIFVEFTKQKDEEKKKKTDYSEIYEKYFDRYINTLSNKSLGFASLYSGKKLYNEAVTRIETIEEKIALQKKKKKVYHPLEIDIFLVYDVGNTQAFHAMCVFKFENFYYDFNHSVGGGNVGYLSDETLQKLKNEFGKYEFGDGNFATRICNKIIPTNISKNITLQTLLNISMLWWSKTDACAKTTFPGSCTGLVETVIVLTGLNELCDNVGVHNSVSLSFKNKKSPKRRSPRKSPKRRSPRKSPRRRSPRKSPKRRSPRKSPKRRSPRKSPRRRSPRN